MRQASLSFALAALLLSPIAPAAFGQGSRMPQQPAQQPVAEQLPYTFSNFPWWTDAQIRAELKHRIPGLGDMVGSGSAQEARVRDELTSMLQSRGVRATVVGVEPSPTSVSVSAFMATLPFYIPGSIQGPHLEFTIAAPEVIVGGISLEASPEGDIMARIARQMEGKPFDAGSIPLQAHQLCEPLQRHGYLSAQVIVTAGRPVRCITWA
jgi:hypothetical protein